MFVNGEKRIKIDLICCPILLDFPVIWIYNYIMEIKDKKGVKIEVGMYCFVKGRGECIVVDFDYGCVGLVEVGESFVVEEGNEIEVVGELNG